MHIPGVPTKERSLDAGTQRARSILRDLGVELRRARIDHGLSQGVVGAAARVSRSQVSRLELGQAPAASILELSRLLAVVGLELGARAYPGGSPIRDRAQLALLARFRAGLGPSVAQRFEVPLPLPGDARAWDLVLSVGTAQFAVEAETRPRDVQAMQRRIALKRRDDPGISAVVLLLADTRHNRLVLREHGPALLVDFPVPGSAMTTALAEGRDPGGSGIVLV
jgi:transcriptional regulator with XRE-family HTH domain